MNAVRPARCGCLLMACHIPPSHSVIWLSTAQISQSRLKEILMEARLSYTGNATVMKLIKHINSGAAALSGSGLPAATQELVKIRAS